ncbi:hypothetical protein C8F01DRAFT_1376757, partial [Mycena amicta]
MPHTGGHQAPLYGLDSLTDGDRPFHLALHYSPLENSRRVRAADDQVPNDAAKCQKYDAGMLVADCRCRPQYSLPANNGIQQSRFGWLPQPSAKREKRTSRCVPSAERSATTDLRSMSTGRSSYEANADLLPFQCVDGLIRAELPGLCGGTGSRTSTTLGLQRIVSITIADAFLSAGDAIFVLYSRAGQPHAHDRANQALFTVVASESSASASVSEARPTSPWHPLSIPCRPYRQK